MALQAFASDFDPTELPVPNTERIIDSVLAFPPGSRTTKTENRVIRLVERRGAETTARIALRDKAARLVETDLLEWHRLADRGSHAVEIAMKPFEIRTFMQAVRAES